VKRRTFIAGLGSAVAWPVVARAQQRSVPVIGYIHGWSRPDAADHLAAFHQGLGKTGYIEGRNLSIEYRFAETQFDRFPALVADVVVRRVDVIVTANTTAAAIAAKAVTQTIPIVFHVGSDPVENSLVASLNRPGGNLTGVTELQTAVIAKRLAMLHEFVPTAKLIALLVNPNNSLVAEADTGEAQAAARILGISLLVLNAVNSRDIDEAFETLVRKRANAILMGSDNYFRNQSVQIAALAARHSVPVIYAVDQNVVAGGLISYGADVFWGHHEIGIYTGRILRGEKPPELPVQQATKLKLVINLKTANALGLTIPETLLATADEVIQ
jgi:putative tryptophan/tyrosine transport system substrate-binding protein